MTKTHAQVVGEKIRIARLRKFLSQDDLARKARIGRHGTVSLIEAGKRMPREATLIRIAEALGINPEVLL